jgi:hypothetical protein
MFIEHGYKCDSPAVQNNLAHNVRTVGELDPLQGKVDFQAAIDQAATWVRVGHALAPETWPVVSEARS